MSTTPQVPLSDTLRPAGEGIPSEPPRSGLAIAAMVCGIVGMFLCPLVGLAGLILGIIALVRMYEAPQQYRGKGMAIAGICTGALSVVLVPALIAILLPSLSRAREIVKRGVDASQLRGIGLCLFMYAENNDDQFPTKLQVLLAEGCISPELLINPCSGNSPPACDYYYVVGLTKRDPGNWIVAYSDPNYHHGEGANILYLDGSVQFVQEQPGGAFSRAIQQFKAAYEEARGRPPEVIPPN